MGCTSQREKIESKMLVLKLQRVVIKQQKKKIRKQIEKIIGGSLKRVPIPDYIDPDEIKRLRRLHFQKQTEDDNSKDENDEDNKEVKKQKKLLKEKEKPDEPLERKKTGITMAMPYEITEEERVDVKESKNDPIPRHHKIETFASSNLLLSENGDRNQTTSSKALLKQIGRAS